MKTYALLLFLHVVAIVIWVGGMFVMHYAVRPAAAQLLEPPQRLPLLAAILQRFLNWVAVAVLVTLATGIGMIVSLGAGLGGEGNAFADGMRTAHPSVHAMFTVGVIMMAIYAHVRFAPFARLKRAVAARDWPGGGRQLSQIRLLVAINLALGLITIGIATLGRASL